MNFLLLLLKLLLLKLLKLLKLLMLLLCGGGGGGQVLSYWNFFLFLVFFLGKRHRYVHKIATGHKEKAHFNKRHISIKIEDTIRKQKISTAFSARFEREREENKERYLSRAKSLRICFPAKPLSAFT